MFVALVSLLESRNHVLHKKVYLLRLPRGDKPIVYSVQVYCCSAAVHPCVCVSKQQYHRSRYAACGGIANTLHRANVEHFEAPKNVTWHSKV